MNQRCSEQKGNDRFCIVDLARMHFRERVGKRHSNHLDLFVIVELLLARLESRSEINENPFLAITRRDIELADLAQLARTISHLFFKLSRGGLSRGVTALDSSRRDFKRVTSERVSPLLHQRNGAVREERQSPGSAVVMDDFNVD